MLNVHPALLEKLTKQLPKGRVIVNAVTSNFEMSSFYIEDEEKHQERVDMKKAPFNANGLTLQISAKEGMVMEDVIEQLSGKYGLCLVKQVDYWDKSLVDFAGGNSLTIRVDILVDAIFYNGSFSFRITNEETDTIKDIKTTGIDYSQPQISLALCSKIFIRNAPSFTGNNLNVDFVGEVVGYLKQVGISVTKKVNDSWLIGEVLNVYNDGVSDIIMINVNRSVYAIRVKLEKGDLPIERV